MAQKTSTKKRRSTEENQPIDEDATRRSITIDLSGYKEWVRNSEDDKLERMFQIGVLAMESMRMTVSSDQKHLEQALASQLDSQMKPIQDGVAGMEKNLTKKVLDIQQEVTSSVSKNILNMTNAMGVFQQDVRANLNTIGSGLHTRVEEVASKVQPLDALQNTITSSESKILAEVKILQESVQELRKPSAKGALGEKTVLNILNTGLPKSFTIEDVSREGTTGDVRVTTPDGEQFIIEVKYHENQIAKRAIEKFEKEVADSSQTKVGIMLSLKSGIAKRSKRGKFEISPVKNKYVIFVPNAMEEENLIVWSVMLANELTQLNVELKDAQKEKLSNLYKSFNGSVEKAKLCRRNLETLETTVANLKENMVPILDMVEQSKGEVYKILHP